MDTIAGRSAVITGGLTGQGLAIARALAKQGVNVAVGSFLGEQRGRVQDAAAYPEIAIVEPIVRELSTHGVKVHAAHLDVRDNDSISAFIAEAEAACGPADILVNAAGTTAEHPVCDHPDELWTKIIDTNLNGAFRMIRAVLPGMMARGWGRIINIGSTAASVGWKDNPAYCASKHGLIGLTRCVALEGAAHGVTCVAISPTWVETELMHRNVAQLVAREGKGRTAAQAMAEIAAQNPQHRIIQPSEIAALAVFLCGDEARGITMENIQITGGSLW
jgi:NAD(P)-dependent dehydrogenase (short-subunit alcohol dehydrogenase family)